MAEEIDVTKDEVLPEDFIFGHLYLLSRCFFDEYEKVKECVKFDEYHFINLQLFSKINRAIVIGTFPFCKHQKLLF